MALLARKASARTRARDFDARFQCLVAPTVRDRALSALLNTGVPCEWAERVERALFELVDADACGYATLASRVVYAVATNEQLAQQDPSDLVGLSDLDLCRGTPEYEASLGRERRQKNVRALVDDTIERMGCDSSSLLRCGRCGGSDVSWDSKQLRSADEGMTIFVQCERQACRARWKM